MSDDEWKAWQATFQQKSELLPAIAAGARTARRKLWLTWGFFFGLVGLEGIAALFLVLAARGPDASLLRISGLGVLVFMAGISVAYLRTQRGLWRSAAATPAAQLEFMERWLTSRQRAAEISKPGGVVICSFTLLHNIAAWLDQAPPPGEALATLVFLVVMQAVFWWIPAHAARKLAPQKAQLLAWRGELNEG